MRMHRTNEKLEQCSVCEKEYLTNKSLRQHMREHDVARHRCQYCEKVFPFKRYLKGHVIRSHREHQVFECGACPAQSWSRYGLKIHQQIQNNELTQNHVKCTMCWKSFSGDKRLKSHMKNHTMTEKNEKCNLCPLGFSKKSGLKAHIKNVHFNASFECQICQKSSSSFSNLQIHQMTVHRKQTHKCAFCDALFDSFGGLGKHTKTIHAKFLSEEAFSCNICEKKFSTEISLKKHVGETHNGVSLFQCSVCPYETNRETSLRQHMTKHTGDHLLLRFAAKLLNFRLISATICNSIK